MIFKNVNFNWRWSQFTDWLRGTPKPKAATVAEWRAWRKMAKKKRFRYWLVETFFYDLKNFICWPFTAVNNVRCYINNRWVIKTHALVSNLKRGSWHDLDIRLLHAVFDELINFVEIESAWMQVVFSKEDRKKYKTPWYRRIFRIGQWHCPEAGLAHLKWASELKHDEEWVDKNSSDFGQPTQQAIIAREVLDLYQWWKEERPKRPDPMDLSGLNAYYDEKHATSETPDDLFLSGLTSDKEDYPKDLFERYRRIETEQEEEDTEMLIRLIKIRHGLWT